MARFSIKPNAMRETIMAYQKLGKDVASKALAKANPYLQTNMAQAKQRDSRPSRSAFQRHLEACENMLTYAVEDSILTNQNIDDLFTKADNLET